MKTLSRISLISAFVFAAALISGCTEKNTEKSSVQDSTGLSSECEESDNGLQTQSNIFKYHDYHTNDNQYSIIKNIRSIDNILYQFEVKNPDNTNTFFIDLNDLSTDKPDIDIGRYGGAYIYNNYLYTIKHESAEAEASYSLSVKNIDDPADKKEIRINANGFSPFTVSSDGKIYYCSDYNIYIYNKDLEPIKQVPVSELGIKGYIRYILCDSYNNVYFLSYDSDQQGRSFIYKYDSSLNEIFQTDYDLPYANSFFINNDGTLNISHFSFNPRKNSVYVIDSENGNILCETDINEYCSVFKGSGDYDYTYYTTDNKLYGYKCSDKSSDILVDLSHDIFGSVMAPKSSNNPLPQLALSGSHIIINSSLSNTGYFETIKDSKSEKMFPAIFDKTDHSHGSYCYIESSFISSSGDVYYAGKNEIDENPESIDTNYVRYSVNKMTPDEERSSLNIMLSQDFENINILAADSTQNIYIGKCDITGIRLEIFDPTAQNIADTSIENVSELKSYFIYNDFMYIYYLDTDGNNHMVRINSHTKKFETVNEFENTNFQKIVNGTDGFDLYVIENTYLHGYSFDKNKYTQLTDNLITDDISVIDIFPINKEKFIVENNKFDSDKAQYLILEKETQS